VELIEARRRAEVVDAVRDVARAGGLGAGPSPTSTPPPPSSTSP
jgi:hypothetical protein